MLIEEIEVPTIQPVEIPQIGITKPEIFLAAEELSRTIEEELSSELNKVLPHFIYDSYYMHNEEFDMPSSSPSPSASPLPDIAIHDEDKSQIPLEIKEPLLEEVEVKPRKPSCKLRSEL